MLRVYLILIILIINFNTNFGQTVQKTSHSNNNNSRSWKITSTLPQLLFHINFAEPNNGVFVLGNTAFDPKEPAEYEDLIERDKDNPMIALGPDGKKISVPKGDFSFIYPKVLADENGTIHLIWAEPDTPFQENSQADFTSIRYARYENGEWSEVNTIYKALSLEWQPNLISDLIIDDEGVLHLLFTTIKYKKPENGIKRKYKGIMHLFGVKNDWNQTFWTSDRAASCFYLDLAVSDNDQLFVACVGPDWDTPNDQNSVFFISSDDYGKTWNEPQLIHLSGKKMRRAIEPYIFYINDTVHLVWGQSLDRGLLSNTFGHVYSKDGGKTWSEVHLLETDAVGPILQLYLVAGQGSNIHLVYTSRPNLKEYHTYHRMWDGKSWSPGSELFPNRNISLNGELLIKKNGDLLIPVSKNEMTDGFDQGVLPVSTEIIVGEKTKQ